MGRKRPEKGRRRGARKKGAPPRDQRRADSTNKGSGAGAEVPGSSRLLLTRLARDGAIWDVYVATTAQSGTPNVTELEFERKVSPRQLLRHKRPVGGPLLEALHSGEPVSRASLEEELDQAVRDGTLNSG